MNTRLFCPSLALIVFSAALLSNSANAAYLESDAGDAERPRVVPPPHSEPENAVTRLIRRVDIGRPYRCRSLTVFPLVIESATRMPEIRTLDEALGRDWLVIEEKSDPQVGVVRVRNTGPDHVLLMCGEILTGGKQNRMVKDDVLLPPRSGTVDVPVYCGERERWTSTPAPYFKSPQSLAHAGLRAGAALGASQEAIWSEIEAKSARLNVSSPTRSYQEIYDDPSVRKQLDECWEECRRLPSGRTVGAVAVAGDRILGADLFSDPDLFTKLWRKIMDSYTLACIAHRESGDSRVSEREARDFLDRALSARFHEQFTPGSGTVVIISGRARGEALVWRDTAVHVALFDRELVAPPPIVVPMDRPIPMWR